MSFEIPSQELTWLKRFFSGQNNLIWQDIESDKAAASHLDQVTPWLKFLNSAKIDRPIVLPLYSSKGPLVWYGMAADDQMFSRLVEEIGSFIGPSYSDFHGGWSDLSNNSEQEHALKERFGTRVIKFSAQRPEDQLKIERALLLYQSLLVRRPFIPERTKRPFGKIRGDFDRALLAGNGYKAQALLEELKLSGRVDAGQQKYLEIRLLAGLGHQEELAKNQALISSVVDLALPAQILIDIVDALYETYIRPVETKSDATLVFNVFRQYIIRPFGASLFKDRKGVCHPTILRSFLLFELIQDTPRRKRCDLILSAYHERAEGRILVDKWYEELPKESSYTQPISLEKIINQALADEDYEVAYKHFLEWSPVNYWVYRNLIRCADELSDLEVKKKTLDMISALSEEIKSEFRSKDFDRIETLKAVCGINKTHESNFTWILWAESVNNCASLSDSIKVLEEYVTKWSVDEYMYEQDICINLAQLIGNPNDMQVEVYRAAFPFLVEFFAERPNQECRTFIPIYVAIIEILALSGSLSPDELEIVSSLYLVLMSNGPSKSTYVESVEFLGVIVDENNSINNLDWALNISELMILYTPVDDGNSRMTFFNKVISIVMASPHRVTKSQIDLLQLLAKDYAYDLSAVLLLSDGQLDADPSNNINFKGFIGIYTLTEGAGSRAKTLLEGYFPNARVETNNDHEATDKLKSLARNADIFVFAWKSSKHQAFFCVKEARKNKETAFPLGKGTASIVNSALEYINR